MSFFALLLFISADTSASVLRPKVEPSREEIGRALTFDRFDDSCNGLGPSDACPPININHVMVRSPQCRAVRPAERARFGITTEDALFCRFKSGIVWGNMSEPKRWRNDSALIYLVEGQPDCDLSQTSEDEDSESCERFWRAAPSARRQ